MLQLAISLILRVGQVFCWNTMTAVYDKLYFWFTHVDFLKKRDSRLATVSCGIGGEAGHICVVPKTNKANTTKHIKAYATHITHILFSHTNIYIYPVNTATSSTS